MSGVTIFNNQNYNENEKAYKSKKLQPSIYSLSMNYTQFKTASYNTKHSSNHVNNFQVIC